MTREPEWAGHAALTRIMVAAEERGLRLVSFTDTSVELRTPDLRTTITIEDATGDVLRMLGRILPADFMQYVEDGIPLVPQPRRPE